MRNVLELLYDFTDCVQRSNCEEDGTGWRRCYSKSTENLPDRADCETGVVPPPKTKKNQSKASALYSDNLYQHYDDGYDAMNEGMHIRF